MNLNGIEYYYIKSAQGDIIGLFDSTGTQVVSYTYDMWGKLIATTGSLATTVGAANPYRYKGYRYDSETGLYYLQSRYYNPDWGRFINADGIAASTGELLSGNMFAYCKNNPESMSDADGDRPGYIGETADDVEASVVFTSKMLKGTSNAYKSSFSVSKSAVRNTVANAANVGVGGKIVRAIKNSASYFNSTLKRLDGARYQICKELSPALKIKGVLGANIGSTINSSYDLYNDMSEKKYFGALMDVAGFGVGCAVGIGIEAVVGVLVGTVGLPALGVGLAAFGVIVGMGMLIDYGNSKAKDEYYGGE